MNEFYRDNHFLYIPNIITQEQCKEVVARQFDAYDRGLTFQDAFRLSDSVQGIFDDFLDDKREFFEDIVGKKLKNSYSYSRIYRPGQILQPHSDRETTEYNISITAGFDGTSIWPFYYITHEESKPYIEKYGHWWYDDIQEPGNRVDIQLGDGFFFDRSIVHWRDTYEQGQWQVQMFLVYMNAD